MSSDQVSENYYFIDEEKKEFYCKPKGKWLPMEKCLVDYLNHNAFEKKRSRCYRCKTGRINREKFADS